MLKSSSVYNGIINTANIAGSAKITIDSCSSWTLTGDTYLTSLTDADTIYTNISTGVCYLYLNGVKVFQTNNLQSFCIELFYY